MADLVQREIHIADLDDRIGVSPALAAVMPATEIAGPEEQDKGQGEQA